MLSIEMDGEGREVSGKSLTLQPFNSCHWNVPLRVWEMAALWPFRSLIIEIKDNWDVSWPGPCAKHLWVVFGGCALSLSSGKEGAVYLSVGIYLDKLENILPPCLTGTGILLLPWQPKQCTALQDVSDPLASPAAPFTSVQGHTVDCVSVLTRLQNSSWDGTRALWGRWWGNEGTHCLGATL